MHGREHPEDERKDRGDHKDVDEKEKGGCGCGLDCALVLVL